MGSPLAWVLFNVTVLGLLALDLGVFHRRAHAVSIREAAGWTAFWVGLSLLFNLGIYLFAGRDEALEFLAGYLIEKSLAVDNLFVFVLIFSYFGVPAAYQHRVLFWGILGALIMRAAFILAGAYVLQKYDWVFYVFGALLIVTGIRMGIRDEAAIDPAQSRLLRIARRVLPLTDGFRGTHFFVRENGRTYATPLLLVLIFIEFSDLVFAIDSIPAIFAITLDPFIVYTSNVFAILGLRSMYFLLAGVIHRFVYLKYALAFVLVFVGIKMILEDVLHVPILASLAIIATALAIGVLTSLRASADHDADAAPDDMVGPYDADERDNAASAEHGPGGNLP